MKLTLILITGIVIGFAAGLSIPTFADKPIQNDGYEKGFEDGRTNGYHAAMEQMEECKLNQ